MSGLGEAALESGACPSSLAQQLAKHHTDGLAGSVRPE